MSKTLSATGISVLLLSLLTGCAQQSEQTELTRQTPDNAPFTAKERTSLRLLLKEYPQHKVLLDTWYSRRAGVDRLLETEDELKRLITQLAALTEATTQQENDHKMTTDLPLTAPEINPTAARAEPVQTPRDYSANQEDNSGNIESIKGKFAVQLVAMSEMKSLSSLWSELQTKAPKVLTHYTPRYEEVTVNNNLIYRLKTGVFTSPEDANQLCRSIRDLQRVCIITTYSGQEKNLFH